MSPRGRRGRLRSGGGSLALVHFVFIRVELTCLMGSIV
jgi:hypothetical protein